jgi:hypothetical protein
MLGERESGERSEMVDYTRYHKYYFMEGTGTQKLIFQTLKEPPRQLSQKKNPT